ncbi:MAG: hypothetical protein E7643_03410 [Ruminococcaceae bacterium]|nr:hypothetical protein [Oscillospiraceae bacterium]
MDFFTILSTLLLGPLKLVFEWIFQLANEFVSHPGISIIFLSLCMNILVLPLYRRADAMQEEARDVEMKLRDGVAHIKKAFSGDERMMILQTYYRQNNYKPTDALKGSLSLLLEIPFFMAAYQFLSSLEILQGVSLGPIKDLAAPDGLLVIGGVVINLLPILMTLINVISCVIYLKGFPLKSKIQLYGMALFFLVFLYTSPAGLVFYWTLNNLFSLVKTIFYKLKNPKRILRILTCVLGVAFMIFGGFIYQTDSTAKRSFLIVLGALLLLPMLLPFIKSPPSQAEKAKPIPKRSLFVWGTLFLTVLVGLLIPATFISASPQEFVDISYFHNPLWYLVSSLCMAAGLFLVWLGVFYWLATPGGKVIFTRIVWILCGVMLVNYMFFGTNLGNMNPALQYDTGMQFTKAEMILNVTVLFAVGILFYVLIVKWQKLVSLVLMTSVVAFGIMSTVHVINIGVQVSSLEKQQWETHASFDLNKNGKNVVVIMLDRAMGLYTPYLFNENPELQEQYAGFTYYQNTISHGGYTNFGSPALFGGYEYTPVEMNKRDRERLVDKHNEALKVMPVLFNQHGYNVTVCDPVYANYQWNSDTSIFDEYEDIDTYVSEGAFSEIEPIKLTVATNHRNFFCFGFMKTMPLFVQPILYDGGTYRQIDVHSPDTPVYHVQTIKEGSSTVAEGYSQSFMKSYNTLKHLGTMTQITDSSENTFMYIANNTTHEPMLLQEPDYVPTYSVDNTVYDAENTERFTLNGVTLDMSLPDQIRHYQTNMAVMMQIGDWLDYLREEGVYDNTRIIIVSDHGRDLKHTEKLMCQGNDLSFYFPLLLVKDFDATEFAVSNEFMTNADVPTLATDGLIEAPINPFTGKEINSDEKTAHDQFITTSGIHQVTYNNGNTFLPSGWAKVTDNLWDKSQWSFYTKEAVLKDHAFPTP